MKTHGYSQRKLATQLEVSPQTVTNWLSSTSFPHPAQLLKLALKLRIPFDKLVLPEADAKAPRVAARARLGRKLSDSVLAEFRSMGRLLEKLVPDLPFDTFETPPRLLKPVVEFTYLQSISKKVRSDIGVSERDPIKFSNLVNRFKEHKAVLIPVLWGEKDGHENALHVFLPQSGTTWVYLNLDTYVPDFNFWMAHELGHVYSPSLSGNESEAFADAFAAALLFPASVSAEAYRDLVSSKTQALKVAVLQRYATKYNVSTYCVFKEVNAFAAAHKQPAISIHERLLHGNRHVMNAKIGTLADALWNGVTPTPDDYVSKVSSVFKTDFFSVLSKYLSREKRPASFVQSVLDIPLLDAKALLSLNA